MRSFKTLLITTALLEAGAGLALALAPAVAMSLLLNVHEPSPEAVIVGRICGAGLLALGVACWHARDDRGSHSQRGLLWAMLVYNAGAGAGLGYAAATLPSAGGVVLVAAVLHVVMTAWCLAELRR